MSHKNIYKDQEEGWAACVSICLRASVNSSILFFSPNDLPLLGFNNVGYSVYF